MRVNVNAKRLMRLLAQDDWYLVATKGSHRQFKHPIKSGKITVPSHSKLTLP